MIKVIKPEETAAAFFKIKSNSCRAAMETLESVGHLLKAARQDLCDAIHDEYPEMGEARATYEPETGFIFYHDKEASDDE